MNACKPSSQESNSEAEVYREENSNAIETEALPEEGEGLLFTEDEIGTVDPNDENNLAEINGEIVDEVYAQKIEENIEEIENSGKLMIPEGYPYDEVPIMQNAILIDSNSYANNGYIIMYEIDEGIDSVNKFYYDTVKQDPLSASDEDIYYENIQLKNKIVLAGLTIEYINDDKTKVYITVFDENKLLMLSRIDII